MAMDEKEGTSNSIVGFLVWIVLAALVGGCWWAWTALDKNGYIPHDKLTAVSSENWAVGEYKDCFSLNIKMDQPVLSCDNLLGGEKERVFKVQFWGITYSDDKPKDAAFDWKCTKTGDSDPSIKCERR